MINLITIGGMTIDDIVTSHGRKVIGAAGGNALYSAAGARLWVEGIGIVSRIGKDYPEVNLTEMKEGGLDISGIIRDSHPTKRVWIPYEKDGTREMIFQKQSVEAAAALDPKPEHIPQLYLDAKLCHISATGRNAQEDMAAFLYQRKMPFSYDITVATIRAASSEIKKMRNFAIDHCSFLMPGLEEIDLIWGDMSLESLLNQLSNKNILKILAVKMGGEGSLVHDAKTGQTYRIPIVPVETVDPTGAGDAYCGGFLAGYYETEDVLESAIRGTVSASFAVENFGAFPLLNADQNEVIDRLNRLRKRVIPVTGNC